MCCTKLHLQNDIPSFQSNWNSGSHQVLQDWEIWSHFIQNSVAHCFPLTSPFNLFHYESLIIFAWKGLNGDSKILRIAQHGTTTCLRNAYCLWYLQTKVGMSTYSWRSSFLSFNEIPAVLTTEVNRAKFIRSHEQKPYYKRSSPRERDGHGRTTKFSLTFQKLSYQSRFPPKARCCTPWPFMGLCRWPSWFELGLLSSKSFFSINTCAWEEKKTFKSW